LKPGFLKNAVAVIENNHAVGLVYCTVQHVDQSGAAIYLQKLYEGDRIESGETLFRRLLLDGCVVNPAGVMVRRKLYEEVGPFTEEIVWGVDWHMWMRIALRSQVAYLAEPLALYRQHPQSGTTGVLANARNANDEMWMLHDIFEQIPESRADLHDLYEQARRRSAHRTWCFAEEMCRLGFMPPARANLRKALSIHPAMVFSGRLWMLWTATYVGYGWFERLHAWKHRLAPGGSAPGLGKQL
jgi:hypothetical protein